MNLMPEPTHVETITEAAWQVEYRKQHLERVMSIAADDSVPIAVIARAARVTRPTAYKMVERGRQRRREDMLPGTERTL